MHNLIYTSSASYLFSDEDLIDILKQSQLNNARLAVTGLLLYHEGSILQILEGEEKVVQALYNKIGMDSRHYGVLKMIDSSMEERSFGDWSMAFKQVSKEDWSKLTGFINLDNKDEFYRLGRSASTQIITTVKSFINVNLNMLNSINFAKSV